MRSEWERIECFTSSNATMHKVNTNNLPELPWSSPKGGFVGFGKEVSEELGRKPKSTDLNERPHMP